jgi:S-DNA-T family DNA segregation ATPase FtsK/SpoIIIE
LGGGKIMLPTKQWLSLPVYKRELIALGGFFIIIFIAISLYSYHPTDPSWFYYTSQWISPQNVCGLIGSYTAALFFFLWGTAAYIVVPLGILCTYWITFKFLWREEWERLIAGIILLMMIAALCTLHGVVVRTDVTSGGYIGYSIAHILYRFLDRIGSLVFLYAATIACLIIMLRFSFIHWAQWIWHMSIYCYQIVVRYHIIQHFWYAICWLLNMIVRPIVWIFQFGVRLFNGSAFEGTGLLDPRDIEDADNDFYTLLLQKKDYKIPSLDLQAMPEHNTEKVEKVMHEIEPEEHNSPLPSDSYGLPSLDIFIGLKEKREDREYRTELEERARILEEKLERFGIYGSVVSIKSGPVVTLFEYQPNIDTKLSKILALEDDLALALQALSIRIIAPIPGRSVVGFEVANKERKDVLLAQVVQSPEYTQSDASLPLILGKDTIGNHVVIDLAKMPHLLIAGSTGSGKSVALNAMLISLLCKRTPEELKLILIDPKRLEFASYADIAHLLFPIVTDPKRSVPILRWIVSQMEERYEKMARYGARNIFDYNAFAIENDEEKFPFIVVIIDELSDLMLTVGREIEDVVLRITQMARAAGIHMIVATQRPSVDVITGLIKVNFPSRISFRVTSRVDSRTILDCSGADKLLGRGDMLFLDSTASILKRVHGAYVSDREINLVVSHIKNQQLVKYFDINEQLSDQDIDISSEDEELYEQIVAYLSQVEEVSISLLQRQFRIGYNRSARIIHMLEHRGLIMPADGSKTRRVIR